MKESELIYDWNVAGPGYEHPHHRVQFDDETLRDGLQSPSARDPDLAAVDVQNRVNQVLGRLPADVRTTGVTVNKNTAGFMGGLGFFSRDNRYSAQFNSNYLDVYVRDALKRVPGVGNVIIFGERK